jgi:hypothetical protein
VKELSLDRLVELIEDNIPDPRRPGGNIRHILVDLFVIILLGIICGCETWIDIEDYAKAKVEWLKTFLELPGGIPSNDTYRRLMERIRPEILEKVYRQWVLPYVGGCVGKHIAVDGKTICSASNNRLKLVREFAEDAFVNVNDEALPCFQYGFFLCHLLYIDCLRKARINSELGVSSCPATFNLSLTASPSCITRMPGRLTCKKCLTGPSTGQAPT